MTGRPPRYETSRRRRIGLAAALVVLFPLAQLGAQLHVALVRHVVCPEHGALIHLARAQGHAPRGDRDAGVEAPPTAPKHQHTACVICAAPRVLSAPAGVPSIDAPPPRPPRAVALSVETSGWVRFSALARAPKTSPPFVS